MTTPLLTAIVAAGCFWGVEHYFEELPGVYDVESGYIGGTVVNPSYEQVCTGKTGHAEAVRIMYNPDEITYREILKHFWKVHNPTTMNRQGPDTGTQYRSAVFVLDKKQREIAEQSLKEAQKNFKRKIVTEITDAEPEDFYPAEEYHQDYYQKHPKMSCTF